MVLKNSPYLNPSYCGDEKASRALEIFLKFKIKTLCTESNAFLMGKQSSHIKGHRAVFADEG